MPEKYAGIDYLGQEDDSGVAAHGLLHDWAQILPQDEGPYQAVNNEHLIPEYTERKCADTKNIMEALNTGDMITFLNGGTVGCHHL